MLAAEFFIIDITDTVISVAAVGAVILFPYAIAPAVTLVKTSSPR